MTCFILLRSAAVAGVAGTRVAAAAVKVDGPGDATQLTAARTTNAAAAAPDRELFLPDMRSTPPHGFLNSA